MKSILFIVLLSSFVFAVNAQTEISGDVKDEFGNPIPFSAVYLDETLKGSSTNIEGVFEFVADSTGTFTLVGSAVGFETVKQLIDLKSEAIKVHFILPTANQKLEQVVISAGSFDASGKNKATMLKPLDIVMNAGAQGDIYKAIETLPGVSKVGDQTGLFVRGGDAHETRTIIDGAIVDKPFFSETPNVASRSRFDPFMFKGTTFTTGGYSAEYGGALSSILLLDTEDIPERSSSSIGLNMAGINLSHQQIWDGETALIGDVTYNNLSLLFNSVPQNVDWEKEPEGFGTKWAFRQKTKKGMIKSLVQHQRGEIGLHIKNFEEPKNPHVFANENSTTYWNTHYKGTLSEKFGLYAGFALNQSSDEISFDQYSSREKNRMLHGKTTIYYSMSEKVAMKFGAETFIEQDSRRTVETAVMEDQYSAIYTESDFSLGERWAFRLGGRAEHSFLLDKVNLAPRTSMAYKTGKNSQVSLAYGYFYQKPEDEFLFEDKNLDFERSTHLIANYQWINEGQSFRIEAYDKRYQKLVKIEAGNVLTNNGEGFSRGIDVFWKDERFIPNLDYWISYSYIDAERDYKDYPVVATPTFITDHTLNLVANYEIKNLGLNPGMTYTYASGRRYFNPNNEQFLSDQTKAYHNLSFNLSYPTELFNNFAVVYASLSNPFGFEQVFGYEYSADGKQREAINPTANRTFLLGLFINFER